MRTRITLGLTAAVSCATLVATVALTRSDSGGSASSQVVLPTGPYVALGDSYTAGPKIPGQNGRPTGCERSDRNYPALLAADLGLKPAEFRDLSCSGATTADLLAAQSTGHGTNPAQLSAVTATTRLVTLGIGGNDIGFSSMVTTCVKAGVFYQVEKGIRGSKADDAPCREWYASRDGDDIETRIDTAGGRVATALGDIKRRAPRARVLVVGYPAVLPAQDDGCQRAMGLAPGDVAFLRQKERRLNDVLRDRARAAGATYVDTYTPSAGRDACADADVRWIEPLVPAAPAAPVHPNARGQLGMSRAVLEALRATG
ncbi:SGNH/GDSL hydrolase family protein [Streptomyces sp. NPDC048278]|uniref:SGNH/GDSL hydrolase family protein n=1 Tax=Streptomyces sp. NPDC048278 TaxID=3155809 RepID=UPI0034355DC3